MDKSRWKQIIKAAYTDDDLCSVIASFLADNKVELKTKRVDDDGRRHYKIWLDRPHIAEVERAPGRRHWVVNERE